MGSSVREQYETWPYPHVPLVAAVRRHHVWQLHCDFLMDRCGQGASPRRPRIWIAGCGTLQPYVFGLANPRARILATDLSRRSLAAARRRCLWHGQYGTQFAAVDLEDESQYPDGPFDLIECYGVLMNLVDPVAALRRMAARLSERGVLRIMVYPHFSRQRIFQVQRLARLLGLRFDDPGHPRMLRRVMAALPVAHPLRYAFDTYHDARNDAGLVDGCLHAGDRGFTGAGVIEMLTAAGLSPRFYFQRPWAQPEAMADKLGLQHTSQSFVLHYLDLWQELRGNFVICAVRSDTAVSEGGDAALRPHPMFGAPERALPAALLGRVGREVFGMRLPSRVGDAPVAVAPLASRRLRQLARHPERDPEATRRARDNGTLLGGRRAGSELAVHRAWSPLPSTALACGGMVPNPLYAHLFSAWESEAMASGGWLGDLASQIQNWTPHADPLEDAQHPVGLTPFGSFAAAGDELTRWRDRGPADTVDSYASWPLVDKPAAHQRLRAFLRQFPDLPVRDLSEAELTELWVLVHSAEQLFVRCE